jgi:hypothetical protein
VVDDVLGHVIPAVTGVGIYAGGLLGHGYHGHGYYGGDYYDTGYYDAGYSGAVGPEYVVSGESGYIAATSGVELIPEAGAGASDRGETRFTRRLLHVTNATDEPITVHVQFRGLRDNGQWVWLPADPAAAPDALTIELAAGQGGFLEYRGGAIRASRVRIWAESEARKWTAHQSEDLWLVSEVDNSGQRAYFAGEMEAFPFTFE